MTVDFRMLFSGSNPSDIVMQGYKEGIGMVRDHQDRQYELGQRQLKFEADQLQLEAAREAQNQQLMKQERITSIINNSNATAQDYLRLGTLYPELQKGAKELAANMNQNEQQDLKRSAYQIQAALKSNNPEIAKQEALRLKNLYSDRNPNISQFFETQEKLIGLDPQKASSMNALAMAAFDDDFAENFSKINSEERAQELQPFEIKAQKDAIKQRAAELGLTKAQTNQVFANTRKLGLQTAKIAAEIEGIKNANNGVVPSEKKIKISQDLRTEVSRVLSDNRKIQSAKNRVDAILGNLETGAELGVADIAATVAFFKAIDPGSTVTATEGGQIAGAEGLVGEAAKIINTMTGQGKYTNDLRVALKDTVQKLYNPAQKEAQEIMEKYTRIATRAQVNPKDIFVFDFNDKKNNETQGQINSAPNTQESREAALARIRAAYGR